MSRRTAPVLAVLLALSLLLTGCGASKTTATGTGSSQSSSQPSEGASAGSSGSSGSSGDCPTSNTKSFAKTKFVLHAGLAFGAFHRYLYKPYKNHAFSKGANGRFKTILKAGAAALFIKREVRLATEDVKANPSLCKAIAAPLAKVGDGISGAVTKLKGGDPSGIEDANSSISSIKDSAAKKGTTVKEDDSASVG